MKFSKFLGKIFKKKSTINEVENVPAIKNDIVTEKSTGIIKEDKKISDKSVEEISERLADVSNSTEKKKRVYKKKESSTELKEVKKPAAKKSPAKKKSVKKSSKKQD
jgi:hypothetical protein